MNISNNNPYNGPKNTCPCGNTINSPQHVVCVHCAKDIEAAAIAVLDHEDHIWDEFWSDWDDTGEE